MPPSDEPNKHLSAEDQLLLNTYIHDYLLKQEYGETALRFQKEANLPTITEEEHRRKSAANGSSDNTLGGVVGSKGKQNTSGQSNGAVSRTSSSPSSSPTSKGTIVEVPIDIEGSFLAEWWTIFWDMFAARQGRASSSNAANFMAHNQRLKAERQNIAVAATQNLNNAAQANNGNPQFVPMVGRPGMKMSAGANPGELPGPASDMVLNPNGPMNAKAREALMRQAMMNNGQRKATYPPTPGEIQRLKTQQYLQQQQQAQQQQQQQQAQQQQQSAQQQQQQAAREDSEQLPGATANHSSPVVSAPSPSKRQRLSPDGAYAQVPGAMRPGQHMPNGPQSQQQAQQMLMKAGINPAGLTAQQLQAFQAQTPVAQQQQLSAYVHNLATQQQRAMQKAANNPAAGGPIMSNSPVMQNAEAGGPPAEGNHALQDYQMQLMLLEQQNKKRLLMARQEQERMAQPGDGQQIVPFNNNSPQSRMPGSPPAGRDLQRGTPKLSNQHGPGSPAESVAQHPMQAQMPTQIPRNASPAVNFMPNQPAADPQQQQQQQQMMYRQAMMQQQQQENGGLPIMMGQQGPVMRPQMQFPPTHPSYSNPQLMQQMMQGQDPRARMFQQQMMQQQQQMQQNGHLRGMTPQQQHQHAMAQHAHAQQQAQQAAAQQQHAQQQQQQQQHAQQGPPSHQQMPPPAAPAQNVMNRGMSAQQGQPPSPSLSNNQPPTPVQQHAKAPMRKTSAKETKKGGNKKKGANQAATPSASEPPTPTTPATPLQGQAQFANHQQQQQHPVHLSSQISGSHLQGDQAGFGAIEGAETSAGFNMGDFGAAGDLDMNMMQDFDFDSFLQDEPANAGMAFAGFGGDDS